MNRTGHPMDGAIIISHRSDPGQLIPAEGAHMAHSRANRSSLQFVKPVQSQLESPQHMDCLSLVPIVLAWGWLTASRQIRSYSLRSGTPTGSSTYQIISVKLSDRPPDAH
ncbi:hypothetical protein BO83DRAFT_457348 [Aspergillus eucalypticola CBS 122712]|uniref:Uncharacterized protein n=1 Tax=Aspergillus eucalypticola (strain CBS 122712 / IBT 29274) TaxID=1448314 RepID=A0A317W336_ASPEC|nr:uncharacterized protein BO83DRAFT_457348 [Aspergillus eucalypticola CBS 122712]PWY81016.1 hypothetical protein BO83DRAFT_457348 [Aspergillus eucalypticola CBS 122712]